MVRSSTRLRRGPGGKLYLHLPGLGLVREAAQGGSWGRAGPRGGPSGGKFRSQRYEILEPLGKGGMGSVYKGHDRLLDMVVAIKFLPAPLLADVEATERFKREAGIAMQLSQEHIVKLYTLQVESGRLFLVMEYVDGPDFRRVLQETPRLSVATVADIASCCCLALSYAHRHGVLHQDLKPENLMLTSSSVLKIVDFGTALRMREGTADGGEYMEGTPAYMSPEQIRGQAMDARSDLYSLGVVLYECLAGRPAFPPEAGPEEVLGLEAPALEGVPEAVAGVIARTMAREVEARWPSAEALAEAFARAAAGR